MPQGKGTYGNQVGRPSKKKKKTGNKLKKTGSKRTILNKYNKPKGLKTKRR